MANPAQTRRLDAVLVADLAALELLVTSDHDDGGLEPVHHTTVGYDHLITAAAAARRLGECTTTGA